MRDMEYRERAPDQLLGLEALVLRLLGFWKPQQGRRNLPGVLLTAITLTSLSIIPAGAAVRLCADFPEDLDELVLCTYIFITCFGSLIKVALFIEEGGTVHELLRLLNTARSHYGSGESSDCIRNRYKRMVDKLYRCFQVMIVPSLMFWVASPLLSSVVLKEDQENHRQLPTPIWLPADIHSSPMYELLYVTQSFCLVIAGEATLCLDVFFVRLMMLVAAEIEVLNQSISTISIFRSKSATLDDHIYEVGDKERSVEFYTSRSSQAADNNSENVSGELFSRLVKNILHHQTILRMVSLLQTTMNTSTSILLLMNMANLCSNMFVTTGLLQRDGNLTKATKALLTVPPILFQTGMYCVFGQITTDQGEKLSDSAFSCGWINCDAHFRRSLLIIMTMVGRPVEITVGKTCQLSKQTLLQVLNGTYALLNMLLQVRSTE
ncbi:odorant receptor 2a-like [Schistocerca nitens]|uniref:odorant receptor 2a-like n=1 Tax=Schistocerca nitens TaxID=7011 RepID=UPI0021198C79|nr:odorant receptor 2a-like [Schistocerca nitens]